MANRPRTTTLPNSIPPPARSGRLAKKGMPPGKYRVAVEYKRNKRDVFQGKFDENRSPFGFEVDSRTAELVIDLDGPPKG